MARKPKPAPKPTLKRRVAARAIDALIANPAGTGGGLVMSAMAVAILVNALAMQPGAHPAPLFHGTRPVVADPRPTQALQAVTPPARPGDLDDLVARTSGRPPSVDSGLVAEIQTALRGLGYYDGEVDGLPGPMTSMAILDFEKDHGLDPLGEPTGDVLAAIRSGQKPVPAEPSASASPAVPPLPRPAPRASLAEDPATGTIVAEPFRLVAAVAPDPQETVDPRLAKIQESLDLLGFGPLRADGRWSPDTRAAIRRFEQNRGLPVTGELNERFLADLIQIGGLSLN